MSWFLFCVGDGIKSCFGWLGEGLLRFICWLGETIWWAICDAFDTARLLLYKLLCLCTTLTNLGFVVGLILAGLNIREAYLNSVFITKTAYFEPMIILFVVHIGMSIVCRVVKPDYE